MTQSKPLHNTQNQKPYPKMAVHKSKLMNPALSHICNERKSQVNFLNSFSNFSTIHGQNGEMCVASKSLKQFKRKLSLEFVKEHLFSLIHINYLQLTVSNYKEVYVENTFIPIILPLRTSN